MKFIRNIFLIAILMVSYAQFSVANHIIGGDIYWECIQTGPDAGKFLIYTKLYRDCSNPTPLTVNPGAHLIKFENHPTLTEIPLDLLSIEDASPTECGIDCASMTPGAIEAYTLVTDPVEIIGVPPPGGFIFNFTICCRPTSQNLINPENYTTHLKGVMYPYQGQDLNPCYDDSPNFAAGPMQLDCAGTPLRFSPGGYDPDRDSISYQWATPLSDGNIEVPFQFGYSFDNPLPNPNINAAYDQAVLDQTNGSIDFDMPAGLIGAWSLTYEVSSWRCGTRVASVTKDMVLQTTSCLPNNEPTVAAPVISLPAGQSGYNIVVNAGEAVQFDLSALDPDLDGAGNPQTITFTAEGTQLGPDCVAPCATVSGVSSGQTSPAMIGSTFNWQTDCDHIAVTDGCGVQTSTYNFTFNFTDNFCPIASTNSINVSVTVVANDVLPSPNPKCVSVQGNGDILINWIPIVDTSVPPSFEEYVIYHSTSPTGPFNTIVGTEANINANSFLHTAASASPPINNGPNYYVIRTRSGCSILAEPVDTVSSIYLTVTDDGEIASLNWTAHATPPLVTSNGNGLGLYHVYKEFPVGTVNSPPFGTTDLFYNDPIDVCSETVTYWIELTDNTGCVSMSNVWTGTLTNTVVPEDLYLDSVSVDPVTGQAILGWQPSGSLDVTEYEIHLNQQDNNGLWIWSAVPPTNLGYNNTSWTYDQSMATSEVECFRGLSIDACANRGSPGTFQTPDGQFTRDRHCTMLLSVELDGCARTNDLSWTPYEYWHEGVREYEIHVSKDGQPELKVAVVPDSVFTFAHSGLQLQADYCYRVRAVRNTAERITSSTAPVCSYVFVSAFPDVNYTTSVTVPNNDEVLVNFYVDSMAGITTFDVKRGSEPDNIKRIGSMPFTPEKRDYAYLDTKALPDFRPYYYRVVANDICEEPMDSTQTSKTILLEATANQDRTNTLVWNAYEGWPDDIEQYNVYRNINGTWEYQATLPPTTLTYTDDVLNIIESDGKFCYYVEAQETGPLLLGDPLRVFDETSRSNIACAPQYPNIFVPNAFTPSGLNKIFKPVSIYVDYEEYVFTVFNRWGGTVFQTGNVEWGWDGTIGGNGGKPAPQGVYGYNIQYLRADGVSESKVGTVVLYR